MDTRELKLKLLKKVMDTDDPRVLRTIGNILDIHAKAAGEDHGPARPNTSEESPYLASTRPLDPDAQDLQDSIDEVFNPEK